MESETLVEKIHWDEVKNMQDFLVRQMFALRNRYKLPFQPRPRQNYIGLTEKYFTEERYQSFQKKKVMQIRCVLHSKSLATFVLSIVQPIVQELT